MVDVPVQASQQLVVILVGRETGIGTGVITVSILHKVAHAGQISERGARNVLVGDGNTVLRSTPHVHDTRLLGHLTVHKEEQLVLDDRTADSGTVGGYLELLACLTDLSTVNRITAHILVAMENVGTATELVGTTLGDSVHTTADEVGLTNIVGRNNYLQLLDGLDADGITATRQATAQAEVVVEVRTVDREVGQTAIGTSKAHTVTTVRRQTRHVGQATGNGGQIADLRTVDVGSGTGLLSPELSGCRSNDYLT